MTKEYFNTNDIESDLRRSLKEADKHQGERRWEAYQEAIQAAYNLGAKRVKELFEEVVAARNLLAVIHRDGGHHFEEHGLESYKAAQAEFYRAENTKKLCEYPCSCC